MTWSPPAVSRHEPDEPLGERAMLEAWLDYHRATLMAKCAGLDAEQLRRRSVEPSSMSLLGLVRHMTEVERAWFRRRVAGESVPYVYVDDSPQREDADFDEVDDADAEKCWSAYREEIERARAAVAGRALDDTFVHPSMGATLNLRWVYVHMIEEYARHNGHADLLRERIDGAVGD